MRLDLEMQTKVLHVENGAARFVVKATAAGNPKEPSRGEICFFRISCAHELSYRLNPEYVPGDDEITAFREGNALFHCCPYSREMIHNLATRMDVFIPPLPFLRVVPKPPDGERAVKEILKKSKKT